MIVGHIGGSSSGGYEIQKSLRFRASASAYLNRTPSVAGNSKTWTWSGWVKRGALSASAAYSLFDVQIDANNWFTLWFRDTLGYDVSYTSSANRIILQSSAVYRDPSAWYAITLAVDTTLATAANRIRIYINGTEIALNSYVVGSGYVAQNTDTAINTTRVHNIARRNNPTPDMYFDGYLSEINFIDGQALGPEHFGQVSAETGSWIPKKYTGTYGTNGFYLPFNDGSTLASLAADRSGNGNNWTANNISLTAGATYDWFTDTPTNNYATLNPLTTVGGAFADGNLRYNNSGGWRSSSSTISVSSGKWSAEVTLTSAPYRPKGSGSMWSVLGLRAATVFADNGDPSTNTNALVFGDNGYYRNFSGAWTDSGVTPVVGDKITLNVDLDANTFEFRVNNSVAASGTIGQAAGTLSCFMHSNFDAANGVMALNFGQRPFAYSPPAGFKALCTKNLPEVPASLLDPTDHHIDITVTKSGNTNFTLPWDASVYDTFFEIKRRDASGDWYQIDGLRGYDKILKSNSTAAETTDANVLGVSGTTCTLKSTLPNGVYIISATKAGLSSARQTNTDGTITSTVSRNVLSGFSIVTYTGTGANATVGHGLGVAPKMVIVKKRNAGSSDWRCYHVGLDASAPNNYFIDLNATAARVNAVAAWNNSGPSSSTFSLGTNVNTNGSADTFVAYCFAEISGYSKIGSYIGNGSADGPFVYCGFRPRWVLYKLVTNVAADWCIADSARDTYNVSQSRLRPNWPDPEFNNSTHAIDFLATGFKVRGTDNAINYNGGTIIFYAIAEQPFQFANAR